MVRWLILKAYNTLKCSVRWQCAVKSSLYHQQFGALQGADYKVPQRNGGDPVGCHFGVHHVQLRCRLFHQVRADAVIQRAIPTDITDRHERRNVQCLCSCSAVFENKTKKRSTEFERPIWSFVVFFLTSRMDPVQSPTRLISPSSETARRWYPNRRKKNVLMYKQIIYDHC